MSRLRSSLVVTWKTALTDACSPPASRRRHCPTVAGGPAETGRDRRPRPAFHKQAYTLNKCILARSIARCGGPPSSTVTSGGGRPGPTAGPGRPPPPTRPRPPAARRRRPRPAPSRAGAARAPPRTRARTAAPPTADRPPSAPGGAAPARGPVATSPAPAAQFRRSSACTCDRSRRGTGRCDRPWGSSPGGQAPRVDRDGLPERVDARHARRDAVGRLVSEGGPHRRIER